MDKHQSLLTFTIIFSLMAHFLIGAGLKFYPDLNNSEAPIEIELIPPMSQNETKKQVVSDPMEELKKKVEELKRKASFLSKNQNLVNEETVAPEVGDKTINLQPGLNQNLQAPNNNRFNKSKNTKKTDSADDGLYKKFLDIQPNVQKNTLTGFSTRTEHIPNVKMGSATALNTDQFTYYTFYDRIQQQLRPRWVNRIRNITRALPQREVNRLGQRPQYTEVEVILSKSGYLENIFVTKGADLKALDLAALDSFKDLTPLLNPPQGMVGRDGKIHIYYGFNIDFRPGP